MPSSWLNKILNYEVNPPKQAWDNITRKLDMEPKDADEIVKLKMLAHEVVPPAAVLDKIFNQLNADSTLLAPSFVERLVNHSEEPPAAAWGNIAARLNEEEHKIIPLNSRRKNIQRIYLMLAGAAAVVAIILIAIVPTGKQNPVVKDQVAAIPTQNKPAQLPGVNSIADTQINTTTNTVSRDTRNPKSSTIKSGNNDYSSGYVKNNTTADLAQNPAASNTEKLQNSKGETPMDIALLTPPNTYISITGADGQTVKVSSKFSSLLSYLEADNADTRENIDVIIAESPKWQKIFSAWKDKMTATPLTPSLSNFMDIIELSKILETKDK